MTHRKQLLRKVWDKAAEDEHDKLTMKEFKAALVEITKDDEENEVTVCKEGMEMIMNMGDGDEDKKLSFDEICKHLEIGDKDNGDTDDSTLVDLIKAADKDNNGFLTATELKELFIKI